MGTERAPQRPACTPHCVLVPVLLSLVASLDWKAASIHDPLEACMEDPDYQQLLKVVTLGLNRTLKPLKVIVVGAGTAGLVASKVLSDAGHKVTILEADNRIGGRILTYRDEKTGWIGELGAMRMPSSHRILHRLCKNLGLNLTQFTQYDENTWTEVNDVKLRNYVVEKMPEKLGYDLSSKERGRSPEDIYQMALNKALKDLKTLGCKKALKKFSRHTLLEYLLWEGNLTQAAVQLLGDVMSKEGFFYLSFAEALRAHSCLSDRLRYSRISGGWDLLPRALLSSLSGPLLLNAPVVAITQSAQDVRVHIATSAAQPWTLKALTADVVLVTTSGPALQRITFVPPLTRRRQQALRQLHYVAASKVFLSFRRPFWQEEHIEGGHSNTDRPSRLLFYPPPGEGGLLLASYTWSDAASPFAGLSPDEAMHQALKDVAALHGPSVIRLWDGTGAVKRWAEDAHSQGGFVVQPPQLWHGDQDYDWATPYGRVYFAGEHTAHPHGWVETAVKSALRAAVKINNRQWQEHKPSLVETVVSSWENKLPEVGPWGQVRVEGEPPRVRVQSIPPRERMKSGSFRVRVQSTPHRERVESGPPREQTESGLPREQVESGPPREQVESGPPREQVESGPPREQTESGPPREQTESGPPREQVESGPPREQVESGPPKEQVESGPPREQVESGPPREQVESGPPREQTESGPPRERVESGPPKEHVESGPPREHVESGPPKDRVESGPPREHVESGPLREHVESGPPREQVESGPPREHVESGPPREHVESGPPREHVESGPPREHVESGPLREHVESGPPREHVESSPPREHVESGPPREQVESGPLREQMENGPLGEHVGNGTPRVQVESGPSREPVENGPPRVQVESGFPRVYMESGPPREPVENGTPRVYVESGLPRVYMESGPPREPVENGPPRVQVESGPPGVQVESGPPRVQVESGPPGVQVESSPPGVQVESGPPGVQVESSPPGVQVESGPPGVQVEGGSPRVQVETSHPRVHVEASSGQKHQEQAKAHKLLGTGREGQASVQLWSRLRLGGAIYKEEDDRPPLPLPSSQQHTASLKHSH